MAIRDNLQGLSSDLLQALTTRVELFGLELQQAKEGLPRLLALWVVGLMAVLFALALLTLLIIVLAWDTTYRDWVVLALCVTYAVIGASLLWRVHQRILAGGLNPFAVTIEELQRDVRCLAQSSVSAPTDKYADEQLSNRADKQDTGL